jgi:hypothetical protein
LKIEGSRELPSSGFVLSTSMNAIDEEVKV